MKIVFWDIMPYDFDSSLDADASYNILMRRIRPGSVIVLHDKPSSSALKYLDRFIVKAQSEGWTFVTVDDYSGRS
jgi:peptidoglycan/xylan/chitin deacetylase (PgdA/CDA1 family)